MWLYTVQWDKVRRNCFASAQFVARTLIVFQRGKMLKFSYIRVPKFIMLYGSSNFEIVLITRRLNVNLLYWYFNQSFFFSFMYFSLNQGTSGTNEEREIRRYAM